MTGGYWEAVAIIFNIAAMSQGEEPAFWAGLLALLPLALLVFTGLNLFVLPYATKWRRGRGARGWE